MEKILALDAAILQYVQENLRSGVLTAIMIFITTLGDAGAIWLFAAGVMLVTKKYRYRGFLLLCCVAVCFAINNLALQNIFARTRPFDALAGLSPLVHRPVSFSFPSGHTSSSFAAAYAICRGFRRGWAVYVLAALIGLSRIYVGVHYPTDVLAGALVGTLTACGTYAAVTRLLRPENTDE